MRRLALVLLLLCAAAQPVALHAQAQAPLDRLQRVDGVKVVPDRFLRSWDPITIFFEHDEGPANGGPEDAPQRLVTMRPAVPGAWQWLGPRSLQFRPADSWKPLQRMEITAEGVTTRLVPLLPTPTSTSPADRAEGIADLHEIALTFEEPVDIHALSRLLTIEVRPSPGIARDTGQVLTAQDFDVMPLERAARDDKQTYLVKLHQTIPDGRVLIVRLRLSDEPGLDEPSFEARLRSAVPFAVTNMSCGVGLARDAVGDVMRCSPESQTTSDSDDERPRDRPSTRRRIAVGFSAAPQALDVVRAREALRLTPAVDDLAVEVDGTRLRLSGRFLAETVYELSIAPGAIRDARGRSLEGVTFAQRFAFAPEKPSLRWDVRQGVVERFGPQFVPARGRGYGRADIRIHAIDPLSRDFWPFPAEGVDTADDDAPPLPGNEPSRWADAADVEGEAIVARIKALGSPAISELITLPLQRGGVDAKFGLDLRAELAKIAGPDQPGTYLVGLRAVDGGTRQWLRMQVTDLTLSTVEEVDRVRFAVTSLATGRPISEAEIRLEGVRDGEFVTLARGMTDGSGFFVWALDKRVDAELRRIVVVKGLDTLVLDPANGPAAYAKENWTRPEQAWLAWTVDPETDRGELRRTLCHVFSERPIYRPEEPVHIKGFVRSYLGGQLTLARNGGTLVITGPNKQEWRIPVKVDEFGGFYVKFDAATPATGDYHVRFEPEGATPTRRPLPDGQGTSDDDAQPANEADQADDATKVCGEFTFKKEAYRLPTFEVLLHGPQQVPLDGEFSIDLLARYFAGGLLADRPVKWRATQFPYVWTPPGRLGFLFSTDARFSGDARFRSTPVLERDGRTDQSGAARITFDTTIEPTAQPRRYFVEATVTGDDDIQVRNVQSIIALPPFVLGVKVPRYVAGPGTVEPELLALDAKGDAAVGLDMTVRFIKRNWISILQASDFSQGSAKYVTQVVDETLVERKVTSTAEAQRVAFETREAGVYLVQLEATDRIGRRQQVSVDFFVGGSTPVTWARAPAQTATITADRESYAPDDRATLVIQSPFQTARALAVVEEPGGRFRYDWVDIANGFGRYEVTLRKEEMPKLAVHFLIIRGRLSGAQAGPTAPFDLGKPVTIAATKWITVTPVKNVATVTLDYPQRARPGQEIEVVLHASDDRGRPLAGQAVFWMVDQAVLSLAKEAPLDPLPNFVVDRPSRMVARDTRNLAFGVIPLEEVPGGDEAAEDWGTENNVSVRKNFTPVPIFLPNVRIGPDGVARIKVRLPDTLTVFKLRAKVVSGPDRFGVATGEMMVRQEVVAQPALPRFLRPGDTFDAGLVGRVVEGPAGPGRVGLSVDGLTVTGATEQRFSWTQNRPMRIDFPVAVQEPSPGHAMVRLRFSLTREADRAADNVQVDLPVRPDRPPLRRHEVFELVAGARLDVGLPPDGVRPGSFERSLVLASDPALVRLVAGLTYLVEYPYGCTEQRISLASATLAMKPFAAILSATGLDKRMAADVRNTAQAIDQSIDADGLVAFWPRARGNVSLTAWAYKFLVAADRAGEPVDKKLIERLQNVLKLALRSDYTRLFAGEELRERVEALTALAEGGKLDEAYVAELARRATLMPNASVAEITAAVARLPGDDRRILNGLLDTLWSRVKVLARDGKPYYAGQAADAGNPVILPSEVRSLAEITRAVAVSTPQDARLGLLRDGLARLGDGSGWGSTNANAAAIQALASVWQRPSADLPITIARGSATQQVALSGDNPVVRYASNEPMALRLTNGGSSAVAALVDTRWQPAAPGFRAQPISQGFVLTRQTWRVHADGSPPERLTPDADGALHVSVGDIVEEVAELANSEDRTHVAVTLPLAAGLEPLNPNLATAPAEAVPSSGPTLPPTWTSFGDDRVFHAYDRLPKGNYRFVFRMRAQVAGSFTQPPGEAETMYQAGVYGASAGQRIIIGR